MQILKHLLVALSLTGLLFYSMLANADLLADIKSTGRLRVAIIKDLPSFSFIDEKGAFRGSDAETARLLAQDLGATVEFVFVPNSERVSSLDAKKVDIILSALSVTPERERIISFSIPYAQIVLLVAAYKPVAINSYADLSGQKVGVGRNTSNGALLKQFVSKPYILEYEDERALIDGYLKREFDIISCQRADIDEINRKHPVRPLEEKFIQKEFAVAVGIRKNDRTLREWINTWIAKNLMNGKLNAIYREYHAHDLPDSIRPKLVIQQ